MIPGLASLALPLLHTLEPERAHELTLRALEGGLYPRAPADDPCLAQTLMGLDFPNPLGLAAGFDKNARVPAAILASGFGFTEIGTVTPRPQAGNPRPRIFRLPRARAMINRLGFNNEGHAAVLERLRRNRSAGIVGINIGANKDSEDRAGDYAAGIHAFWEVASYFTVNISSPNTPGLRDLQAPRALDALLARVMEARAQVAAKQPRHVPVALKLSPDIADEDLAPITECLMRHKVDAIIISNTTLSRTGVESFPEAREEGGLSGAPLFARSTQLLARVYRLTGGHIPLIGVGGICSGKDAVAKIEAGASLVQLYTGLVYGGPVLVNEIKSALARALRDAGAGSIGELTGRAAEQWLKRETS